MWARNRVETTELGKSWPILREVFRSWRELKRERDFTFSLLIATQAA